MKITLQDETIELLRKALSVCLDCTSKDLRALSSLLELTDKFELTNGIALLVRTISNNNKLNSYLNLDMKLNWDLLESSFDAVVSTVIQRDSVNMSLLTDEVLSAGIPEQALRMASLLKADLKEEFDMLVEYSISKEELLPALVALRDSFKIDMCAHYLRLQATCMSEDVYVNRKKYRGVIGYEALNKLVAAELSTIDQVEDTLKVIDSAIAAKQHSSNEMGEMLFPVHIGPIDRVGGIPTNGLVIIQAHAGVGKTTFLKYLGSMARRAGVLAALYGGETEEEKLWCGMESHDFYLDTGMMIPWGIFKHPEKIEDVTLRTQVEIYNETYFESKGLVVKFDNINLTNFQSMVTKAYEEQNVRVFLIDNVASFPVGNEPIRNPGSVTGKKEVVDTLGKQMIALKKTYPITFVVANWVKSKYINFDTDNYSITGGLYQDADLVIELSEVENLSTAFKAGHIKKCRDSAVTEPLFLLETYYVCNHFAYNPEIQHLISDYKRSG